MAADGAAVPRVDGADDDAAADGATVASRAVIPRRLGKFVVGGAATAGARVGCCNELSVCSTVGVEVRAMLRAAVGSIVGITVGFSAGAAVGNAIRVGAPVGNLVRK